MSRKHFGTDGIRGVANRNLTPELAFQLGVAAGRWLQTNGKFGKAIIGRDTRKSGSMLGAAMASGLNAAGIEVVTLGVVPTPTVSYLARSFDFDLGVVISASHNPAPDNGIKLFGGDGKKLPDATELLIEQLMESPFENRPEGGAIGAIDSDRTMLEGYLNHLTRMLPERLDGMRIAVDGANGAAYQLAPEAFLRLGAEVVAANVEPDGLNINQKCGATHPSFVQELTVTQECDFGVAFDGDADRVVFSDEKGRLINGDRAMGIWATHWQRHNQLDPKVVVGTVMSNGGFEAFLTSRGIQLERAAVGDKYVVQRMNEVGALVGGEQSGHLIFPKNGPTGDGIASALEVLRVVKREERPLSAFFDDFEPWPQLLLNVAVNSKDNWDTGPLVNAALDAAYQRIEGKGRLNVRPSGTQPMIRIMVEAKDLGLRDEIAESIIGAMTQEIGGTIYSRVDLTYDLGD